MAVLATIALSLTLFACADTGKQEAAAVSAGPAEKSAASKPAAPQAAAPAAAPQVKGNTYLTEDERNTIEVVRKTRNSVVFITNLQYLQDFFFTSDSSSRGAAGRGSSGTTRATSSPTSTSSTRA
jgi:hypothetical protein